MNLIDFNRFELAFAFNKKLVEAIKNFDGSWKESQYCWQLNNNIKDEILARFQLLGIAVKRVEDSRDVI